MERYLASEPRPEEAAAPTPPAAPRSVLRAMAPVQAPGGTPVRRGAGSRPASLHEARRVIERESAEVTAAILAVSGGRMPWIMVCNLRHPSVAAESLRGLAAELGLEVGLVGRPSGPGLDVLVRARRP